MGSDAKIADNQSVQPKRSAADLNVIQGETKEVEMGNIKSENTLKQFLDSIKRAKKYNGNTSYWKAQKMTTEELKKLWDSYDRERTSDPEIQGEKSTCPFK